MKTDQKAAALIVKEDGKIYVNEVPEEPTLGKCSKEDVLFESFCEQHPDKCICNSEWIPYQKALVSAKETAVLCADQEQARELVMRKSSMGKNKDGFYQPTVGVHPIPDLKWEVKHERVKVNNKTEGTAIVAILTLSEQPKGELFKDLTPEMSERLTKHIKFEPRGEESQEELWKAVSNEINEEGLWLYEDWDGFKITAKGFAYLMKQFTITRNLKENQ